MSFSLFRRDTDRVVVNVTPKEAQDFFHKLASDDNFRRSLEQNPEEELARFNIMVAPGAIGGQPKLPPKEEVQRMMRELDSGQTITIDPLAVGPFVAFLAFFAFMKK